MKPRRDFDEVDLSEEWRILSITEGSHRATRFVSIHAERINNRSRLSRDPARGAHRWAVAAGRSHQRRWSVPPHKQIPPTGCVYSIIPKFEYRVRSIAAPCSLTRIFAPTPDARPGGPDGALVEHGHEERSRGTPFGPPLHQFIPSFQLRAPELR